MDVEIPHHNTRGSGAPRGWKQRSRGEDDFITPPLLHELPARAVYNLLQLPIKAPIYCTTMTIQQLWHRVKRSKWYKNFRRSLLLDRWPTLTQAQMKLELKKQHLNRLSTKHEKD